MATPSGTPPEPEREACDPLTPPDRLRALASTTTPATETCEYEVFFDAPGPNPISVVRLLRERCKIGLKDAFDRMRSWPCVVHRTHDHDDAIALRDGLRAIKAEAHLRDVTGALGLRLALLVAANPAAPPDLLEHLASRCHAEIGEAVAANPNAPPRLRAG